MSTGILQVLSDELVMLVERSSPGVVGVEHAQGHGSGVVLAGDGYVVTNSHVIRDGAKTLRVRVGAADYAPARVVGDDPTTDLAVLQIEARGLSALTFDERPLRVGQLVVAIGDPMRLERSVSLGVVSALERTLVPRHARPIEGLIQTDAAVNPGNSGGPLVNAAGDVVGIATAVMAYAQGIGFAVPTRTVCWVAATLLQHGAVHRPLLGISARSEELPEPLARDVGQPRALRVHAVSRESGASRAGLHAGDLLLGANGRRVGSIDDLQRILVLARQSSVELDVLTGGERRAVEAPLALAG